MSGRLLVGLAITGAADVASTAAGLALGLGEAVPGLGALYDSLGVAALFVHKTLVVAVVLVVAALWRRWGPLIGWWTVAATAAGTGRNIGHLAGWLG